MARVDFSVETVADPVASARAGGLEHITDVGLGIRRRRAGKAFIYLTPRGRLLRDARELKRIRRLVIPPAWTDVWICPSARGHIQATGRDARGRKQYRYHPRWRELRDGTKFSRMVGFARALPRVRARVARDLVLPDLPRAKVVATVVRLLERTCIRVGNEEYVRQNASFGLTTLRDRHVRIDRSTLHFRFRGKSGKEQEVVLSDARLARIVERCRRLPGRELFKYVDGNGARQSIGSADVNAYLRAVTGEDFTAKDFRTWSGTVLAALALDAFDPYESVRQAKKNIVRAIEQTAEQLGNTPAVCRKSYVHPAVIEAYLDGLTLQTIRDRPVDRLHGLRAEESAVLALLEQRLAPEAGTRRAS